MARYREVKRLTVCDIQRMLCWIFNLSKRPSFLPLRSKDRPLTVNIVELEASPESMSDVLNRFDIKHTARVNENIPFCMLLDCLLRDGDYCNIKPCLDCISVENLAFIPMIAFNTLYSSDTFINSEMSLMRNNFDGYKRANKVSEHDIVALDVEKVETDIGKELGRVTMVDSRGKLMYDKVVRPKNRILNYLTRYSGLTEKTVDGGVDVESVKKEILDLVGTNTVVVGHGIENDLSSLELYHHRIIDTAHLFLNPEGRKVSLAQLSRTYLGKTIHEHTHDSRIDATTCLELLSVKIQHVLSIMNKESPRIKIDAEISTRHIADVFAFKEKQLNLVSCNYKELEEYSRDHKTGLRCLWMFLYEVDGKVYFSF